MAKRFPNLMNSMNMYTNVISSMKSKKKELKETHMGDTVIKNKDKRRILKGVREKQLVARYPQ